MRRIVFVSAVALFCLFSTTGQAPAATGAVPPAVRVHRSDAEIEAIIHTKLAKSKIGKDGLTVHVKGGVAIWEGTTNVMQHKGAAARMAKTAGAIQVVNKIKITDEDRQKAAGNLTGSVRKATVKTN